MNQEQGVLRNQFRFETTETGTETSFDSIQNKTYPKQNIFFGCFASIPKQRNSMFRLNQNKQKTIRNSLIESIFCYFLQKIQGFSVFFVFFVFQFFPGFFRNSLFRSFRFYTETESFDVSIELKQTADPPKQFKREYIWVFFKKIRVASVYFGLLQNRSVCFGCFHIGSKHRNKPKFFVLGFTKQTETNAKQILFRFVSVRTEIYFCLFLGHPNQEACAVKNRIAVRVM